MPGHALAEQVKQQSEKDARALNLVTQQMNRDPYAPRPGKAELDDAISKTSPQAWARICSQAWEQVTANFAQDKASLALTIPVLMAIIASDSRNVAYHIHAQLGFALGVETESGLRLGVANNVNYEFGRAICRIRRDPFFREKPCDDNVKNGILSDLRSACTDTVMRNYLLRGGDQDTGDIKLWLQVKNSPKRTSTSKTSPPG